VLVERLLASQTTPIICVVAPAGYGKTTMLAQWAERTGRPVAWVSVDQHDNDPATLLTHAVVVWASADPVDGIKGIDPLSIRHRGGGHGRHRQGGLSSA
jgi:hypothetical protein